jgi:hypothetical protein
MKKTITKIKVFLSMLALLLGGGSQVQAQLAAGDILFTGYESRTTDRFTFILLRELSNNVTINFTDRGYGGSSFNADNGINETSISWSSGFATLPVGTEIVITGLTATLAKTGSVVGSVTALTGDAGLSLTSADQIIAYTGVLNAGATPIAGIHWANCGGTSTSATWDPISCGSVTTSVGSTMPVGLANTTSAMWTGVFNTISPAAGVFNTPVSPYTSVNSLRAAILNNSNWSFASGIDALTIGGGATFYEATPPSIHISPSNATTCATIGTVFFSLGSNYTSVKWQVKIGNGEFTDITDNATYSGATTPTLILYGTPVSANGNQYRAVYTNSSNSAYTTPATLTVVNAPPIFSSHPSNTVSCDGGATSLTAAAAGDNITYKWQVNSGSGFVNITDGAVYAQSSTPTLMIANVTTSMHGYRYRLAASNSCGTSYSNESTLSVGISWTGAINSNWDNPGNWACNTVPTTNTDVIINPTANSPIVNAAAGARNITIGTNANLVVGNNQSLTITGNVQNLGVMLASNFGATVVFNSSTDQVIPSLIYNNLTATGGGNKSLAGDVKVMNSTWFYNSSKILIGDHTFTLGPVSSVGGGSPNSYFVTNGTGGLKWEAVGATQYLFHIGTLTSHTPIIMSNSGVLDNFTARVTDNVYANYLDGTPQGSPITSRAVARTWSVTEDVPGGSNATMYIQWDQSAELSGFKRTSASIWQYTGAWNSFTPSISSAPTSGGPHYLFRNGLTSFGTFGIFSPTDIESVSATSANGLYKVGDNISIQVTFPNEVFVSGSNLQLQLETGSTDRIATYVGGSGSSTLTFAYTVQNGDSSPDLDYVSSESLLLNGASIIDSFGADVILTLPTPGATGSLGKNNAIVIDGVSPIVSISSTAGASGSTTTTTPIPFTITFSEPITGLNTGSFSVTNGTVSTMTGSGDTYNATVLPSIAGTATTLTLPANTALDEAGNGNTASSTYAITYEEKLPVNLVAFTAQPVGNTVRLAWTTASESNNKSFTIYRSSDARKFVSIATIDGGGNSQIRKDYVFVDREPLPGVSYYKLRQTDYDGVYVDFRMKAVDLGLVNSDAVSLSPNPTTSSITVNFSGDISKIEVINLSGRIVTNSIVRPGEVSQTINLGVVPSGMYFVRLIGEKSVKLLRFVKI